MLISKVIMFGFGSKRDYYNMNDRTRKPLLEWCATWDNDLCQGCGRTFADLESESQIIEEMTGRKRILSVYVLDHRDGDSSHLDGEVDVDMNGKPISYGSLEKPAKTIWHKFGNMRRYCWSCNKLAGIIKRKSVGQGDTTRAKLDRINNEGVFIYEVENLINKKGHVCFKAMIKAGKNICDSSEVTCERYLTEEIKSPENPSGIFRIFHYPHITKTGKCGGDFCNGDHVSFASTKPDLVIDAERQKLEQEWETNFGYPEGYESDPDGAIQRWKERWHGLTIEWIPKEQYVNKRIKFNWND